VREVKGERILLHDGKGTRHMRTDATKWGKEHGRRNSKTYEQPSLNALTIVLIRSNLRSSHSASSTAPSPPCPSTPAVTEEITRKVVRSKSTISEAAERVRKEERCVRRDAREGMRCEITIDQACANERRHC
jgi:hypothetical protein